MELQTSNDYGDENLPNNAKGFPDKATSRGIAFCTVFHKVFNFSASEKGTWYNDFENVMIKKSKGKWARTNDPNRLISYYSKMIQKELPDWKPKTFLDYGTGDGSLGFGLATKLDISAMKLADQSNRILNKVAQPAFYPLDNVFEHNWFCDLILVNNVLHHISTYRSLLPALLEKLNPHGCILIHDHQISSIEAVELAEFTHFCYEFLEGAVNLQDWQKYTSHSNYMQSNEIKQILLKHNFIIKRCDVNTNFTILAQKPGPVITETIEAQTAYTLAYPGLDISEKHNVKAGAKNVQSTPTSNAVTNNVQSNGKGTPNTSVNKTNLVNIPLQVAPVAQPLPGVNQNPPVPNPPNPGGPNPPPQPGGGPNPPVVVPNAVNPPQVVTPALLTYGSIDKWAKVRKVQIQRNEKLERYVKENDIPYEVNANKHGNTHPWSAMFRDCAIKNLLTRVGKDKTSVTILDWYGSERNKYFCPPPSDISVNWHCSPIHAIAGDAARGFNRTGLPPVYDTALIQDVYQSGTHYSNKLNPLVLSTLASASVSGCAYVLIRPFVGDAGVDSEDYDEGAWYRTREGLISFSPDPTSTAYAPHPDANWLFEHRSFGGLSIAALACYGPYTLFCVSAEPIEVQELAPMEPLIGVIQLREVAAPGKMNSWVQWGPRVIAENRVVRWLQTMRRYPVHMPTFLDKNILYRCRSMSGSLMDSIRGTVLNAFMDSPTMRQIKRRFPVYYNNVVYGTSMAIMLEKREEDVNEYVDTVDDFAQIESSLIDARSALPTNRTWLQRNFKPWMRWTALGMALFTLLKILASFLRVRPAATFAEFIEHYYAPMRNYIKKIRGSSTSQTVVKTIANYSLPISVPERRALQKSFHNTTLEYKTGVQRFARRSWDFVGEKLSFFKIPKFNSPKFLNRFTYSPSLSSTLDTIMETTSSFTEIISRYSVFRFNLDELKMYSSVAYVVIGAPCVEEYLRYWPVLGTLQMILEMLEKWFIFKNKGAVLFSFLFHSSLQLLANLGMPYAIRVALHSFWNFMSVQATGQAAMEDYRKSIAVQEAAPAIAQAASYLSPFLLMLTPKPPKPIQKAPLSSIRAARMNCEKIHLEEGVYSMPLTKFGSTNSRPYDPNIRPGTILKIKVDGESLPLSRATSESLFQWSQDNPDDRGIYPLISPLNFMHRPAVSPINMLNAVSMRVANNPYPEIGGGHSLLDAALYAVHLDKICERWKKLTLKRLPIYPQGVVVSYTLDQAVATMPGAKRKRILAADKQANAKGPLFEDSKSVSIKHDELIMPKIVQGAPSLKPRAIVQFSPLFISQQTTYSHTYADILHSLYNEDVVYEVYNKKLDRCVLVSYIFCSGYTSQRLNAVMRLMLQTHDRVFVLVAGDDSLIKWGPLASLAGAEWAEGDFRMYDHTQGRGPMIYGDSIKFAHMGFPWDFIERNATSASSPFSVRFIKKKIKMRINFKTDPQQTSGNPLTTNGNSDHNIDGSDYGITNLGIRSMEASFYRLGFLLKTRVSDSVHNVTFLKGWWMPTVSSVMWLPLPSCILKIGKVLDDPCKIAKDKDLPSAIRKVVYALARSPGVIPKDYPICGPFIHKMLSLGTASDLRLERGYKKMMVEATSEPLNLDLVYGAFHHRYGISREQVTSFHTLVATIDQLPVLISHPIFELLGVDYE